VWVVVGMVIGKRKLNGWRVQAGNTTHRGMNLNSFSDMYLFVIVNTL
jgi:hypothetical protein